MQTAALALLILAGKPDTFSPATARVTVTLNRQRGTALLKLENAGQRDLVVCKWPGTFRIRMKARNGVTLPVDDPRYQNSVSNVMPYHWVLLTTHQSLTLKLYASVNGKLVKKIPASHTVWIEMLPSVKAFQVPASLEFGKHDRLILTGKLFAK
ncbi:MAG: hypothetical protein ABL962_12675 [Fimbriimonadaceae bacterium]